MSSTRVYSKLEPKKKKKLFVVSISAHDLLFHFTANACFSSLITNLSFCNYLISKTLNS